MPLVNEGESIGLCLGEGWKIALRPAGIYITISRMIRKITSSTNPLIKELRQLATSKKARQSRGEFLVEGWRGIDTLLKHPAPQYTIEQLIITPEWTQDTRLPESIETIELPAYVFAKISDVKNAQGILAVVRHPPTPVVMAKEGHYLILDNLRDPGNLGTLIRSAVGAGYTGILLYGDCVDPRNPKVIRSTMGTFAHLDIFPANDDALDELEAKGFTLYATTGKEGENLYTTSFPDQTALIIGSEAHGISTVLMERATHKITIPLNNTCESLNAAIAGSICMFHISQLTR